MTKLIIFKELLRSHSTRTPRGRVLYQSRTRRVTWHAQRSVGLGTTEQLSTLHCSPVLSAWGQLSTLSILHSVMVYSFERSTLMELRLQPSLVAQYIGYHHPILVIDKRDHILLQYHQPLRLSHVLLPENQPELPSQSPLLYCHSRIFDLLWYYLRSGS
jgi:hypothetical protein